MASETTRLLHELRAPRIAFATCSSWAELTPDDRIAAQALRSRGFLVTPAVWDDAEVDWRTFDAVVIRSCWDYHLRPETFRGWLARLDELERDTWNATSTVRWNLDKGYLADLGVPVVPTVFLSRGEGPTLAELRDRLGRGDLVVKPRVGASSHGAWRASRGRADEDEERLRSMLAEVDLLVQPLVEEILTRGEWSLVYFCGSFSHAVLKRAKDGDFRVQGGTEVPAEPPAALVELAERTLAEVDGEWLYARVDMVEVEGRGLLMELELVEPDLFFRYDRPSLDRFCTALEKRCPSDGRVRR